MKRTILTLILAATLLINLTTGCTSQLNTTNEDTTETTEDPVLLEQKEVITEFYDTFYALNEALANESYSSLEQEVDNTVTIVKRFDEAANNCNDSEYASYFSSMEANPMYITYRDLYITCDDEYELDSSLTTDVFKVLIQDAILIILEQPLPFEYDKQITAQESTESNTKDYSDLANQYLSILNAAINNGTDITVENSLYEPSVHFAGSQEYGMPFSSYPNNTTRIYISFTEDGNMRFFIFYNYNDNYNMENYRFSDGTNEIKIDTTQMEDVYVGVYINLFESSYDDSMNETYKNIRNLVRNSEQLYMAVGDSEYSEVPAELLSTMKNYFDLFDTLLVLYGAN